LLMVRKKPSCHDCGAEALDECEGYKEAMHVPAYPTNLPCRICLRNPETAGWYDMFSENWAFSFLDDNKIEPLFEDPTKHEQKLLDIIASVVVKECSGTTKSKEEWKPDLKITMNVKTGEQWKPTEAKP